MFHEQAVGISSVFRVIGLAVFFLLAANLFDLKLLTKHSLSEGNSRPVYLNEVKQTTLHKS